MTAFASILRPAAISIALGVAAIAAPVSASAATAWTAATVQAAPTHHAGAPALGAAAERVKFFKKKVFRRGHSGRHGAHGHHRGRVAGVGHGRSLTGRSAFDRSGRYGRVGVHNHGPRHAPSHGHGGGVVLKKGVFPFGLVIVK